MTVRLRPVQTDDQEFLYQLYASTRAVEMAMWSWPEAQAMAFLQMQFRARELQYAAYPHAQDQIILWNEQPAGRWLLARPAGEIRLVEIALLPAYQRRGIGTQILEALQNTAQTKQLAIRLHVAYDNPARLWYTRHGFAVLEDRGTHWLMEWPNRAYSGESNTDG